jgi:hypothetical protein
LTIVDTLNTVFMTENILSYLVLFIIVALVIGIGTRGKLIALPSIIVSVLLGLFYLDGGLGWHSIVMFLSSFIVMVYTVKGK